MRQVATARSLVRKQTIINMKKKKKRKKRRNDKSYGFIDIRKA
jgi:hypothetical protein